MNIIEMKGIKKDYPLGQTTVHALKGVDFAVEEGELLSIVGPSGSGKTTLLNIIGCIDTPTEGSFELHGNTVFCYERMSEAEFAKKYPDGKVTCADKRHYTKVVKEDGQTKAIVSMDDKHLTDLRLYKVGFIFQTFNLIPVLDVLENVEFPLLLMKDISRKEIRERAEHFIEAVGIKEYVRHRPAELSGGQRQRVAIARALVTKPDIILADEPTANLDSVTGNHILENMQKLNEEEKTTFIFSTHDPEVLKYAKRIVKIRDGLIVND